MSCVLDGKSRDCVMTPNGNYVVIDSCWTLDCGWETMVFRADKFGFIQSYTDLDVKHYNSAREADIGHTEMINKWMKEVLV